MSDLTPSEEISPASPQETAPPDAWPPPNPYVGPRPFEPKETLYGREREVEQLVDRLCAERIVLFYSPSGAGKTSLLQASLIPQLREEEFRVLPILRVHLPAPKKEGVSPRNRYVLSALQTLEEGLIKENLPESQRTPLERMAGMELAEYLRFRPTIGEESVREILIFDQFEEILTADPTDVEAKREFFRQLGAALRETNRWALVAMREDYVPALEPYLHLIPGQFRATFRMDLLREKAAMDAVCQPAAKAKIPFEPEAARRLVDNLRRVQVQEQEADGSTKLVYPLGQYIEPLYLQVVCWELWNNLPRNATLLTLPEPTMPLPASEQTLEQEEAEVAATQAKQDTPDTDTVDKALAGYYRRKVKEIAAQHTISERNIRLWIGSNLILTRGVRQPVVRGDEAQFHLTPAIVGDLVKAGLVRQEVYGAAILYELIHDRLIDPVRHDNEAWDNEGNLNPLQRRGKEWDKTGTLDILRGAALEEMEAWAKSTDEKLTDAEQRVLQASRDARKAEEEKRQRDAQDKENQQKALQKEKQFGQKMRRVSIVAVAFALLAALVGFGNWKLKLQEQERNRKDAIEKTAARAETLYADDPALGMLLAEAADRLVHSDETYQALLAGMTQVDPRLIKFLYGDEGKKVTSLALHPNGRILASGWNDGSVILWNLETYERLLVLDTHLGTQTDGEVQLTFTSDGKWLCALTSQGTLVRWQANDGTNYTEKGKPVDVAVAAFGKLSFGGSRFAAPNLRQKTAFSPDGMQFAIEVNREIHVWNVLDAKKKFVLPYNGIWGDVRAMAFDPKGERFAVGTSEGYLRAWNVSDQKLFSTRNVSSDPIHALIFMPDANEILFSTYDYREDESFVLRGDARKPSDNIIFFTRFLQRIRSDSKFPAMQDNKFRRQNPSRSMTYEFGQGLRINGEVFSIQFSPQFGLAAGANYGVTLLENSGTAPNNILPLRAGSAGITAFCLDHQGKILVTGSGNRLMIWDRDRTQGFGVSHPIRNVSALAYDGQGKQFATAAGEGKSAESPIWKTDETGNFLPPSQPSASAGSNQVTSYENPPATPLVFDPSDSSVRAFADGDTVRLWKGKEALGTLPNQLPDPRTLAFSPDGKLLACGGESGDVIVWERSPDGRYRLLWQGGKEKKILSLCFRNNGKSLLYIDKMGTVWEWDGNSQTRETDLKIPIAANFLEGILLAVFGNQGNLLAVSNGSTIETWDMVSKKRINVFRGKHENAISALAIKPDGTLLLVSGDDAGSLVFWEMDTGRSLAPPMRTNAGKVLHLTFRPDGKQLAFITQDQFQKEQNRVHFWDLDRVSWQKHLREIANRSLSKEEWNYYFKTEPDPVSPPESFAPR